MSTGVFNLQIIINAISIYCLITIANDIYIMVKQSKLQLVFVSRYKLYYIVLVKLCTIELECRCKYCQF